MDARRASFDFPPIDQARGYDAIDVLEKVAQETSTTIALAWVLAQPGVTSVIIGANKESQLEDNLKAADLELTEDQLSRLSSTTAPPKLYPQWMIELQNAPR